GCGGAPRARRGWRRARRGAASRGHRAIPAAGPARRFGLPSAGRGGGGARQRLPSAGFFYLVGHGVPCDDVRALHGLARDFFALPPSQKAAISMASDPAGGRGYQRLGENVTEGRPDWHEAIDFLAEPGEGDIDFDGLGAWVGAAKLRGMRRLALSRNLWPPQPAALRPAAEAHFARMRVLGQALMDATAQAFGLPPDHLAPLVDRSFWVARIIGYPPLGGREADGVESCGEHTDYGWWTLLSQDETPGALEVRTAAGDWTTVEPLPGAFVVNLGDMLHVWSGRRFKATPHRVRQTQVGCYRTSVAFFFEPNFDAVIRPVGAPPRDEAPSACGDGLSRDSDRALDRALGGAPIAYGEHLFDKISSNFSFQ
ncbi:unnamed protein product, partial [Prorocentrum cordatum]